MTEIQYPRSWSSLTAPGTRYELLEMLGEISLWGKSTERVYLASYFNFLIDDLDSDPGNSSPAGQYLFHDELPAFWEFSTRLKEFSSQFSTNEILKERSLTESAQLTELKEAASVLREKMARRSQ